MLSSEYIVFKMYCLQTSVSYAYVLTATSIPKCYRAVIIQGFVEELVVNEDPEYQWIDRIRTPRASNEARQRLISLMSGSHKLVTARKKMPLGLCG